MISLNPVARALATTLVALCAVLPSAAQSPGQTFKGKIKPTKSVPMIPPQGVALQMVLQLRPPGALAGTMQLAGSTVELQSLEADGDEWTAQANVMGMPTAIEFRLEEDVLIGRMKGGLFTVEFELERAEAASPQPAATRATVANLAELQTGEWLVDLAYLEEQLPVLHAKWYDGLTEQRWSAAVESLRAEIGELSHDQVVVRLAQLVALRGDAHSTLHYAEAPEFAACAVSFEQFAEGVFVTQIAEPHRAAVGGRVVRVGGHPIELVLERIATVRASENEQWKRGNVDILRRPAVLYGLGLLSSADRLSLVVERNGEEQELQLTSSAKAAMASPFDGATSPPLWLTRGGDPYRWAWLDRGETLYFAYNQCRSDPSNPFPGFAARLAEEVERRRPQRVFVDLRRNGGGGSRVLEPIVDWLAAHPVLNDRTRLFVAIGRRTFSSAMLNATHFDERTKATLLGEPTGGKPNAYGEVRGVRLPRSGLLLWYSTQYFHSVEGDPPSVDPHRRIELGAADYFAGRDPVLAAARATTPQGAGWEGVPAVTTVDGVWGGALEMRGAGSGGTMTFALAVRRGEDGEFEAAIDTVLHPSPLLEPRFDEARGRLEARVKLVRFPEPVPVSFVFDAHSVRGELGGPAVGMSGHGLRLRGRTPDVLLARAQFEAVAADAAQRALAVAAGERLLRRLSDDADALNTLAWRLLTEDAYGHRFDALALTAARRGNELTEHANWRHLDTLALAEFSAGHAERAIELERRALRLAGDDPGRGDLEAALARFVEAAGK